MIGIYLSIYISLHLDQVLILSLLPYEYYHRTDRSFSRHFTHSFR